MQQGRHHIIMSARAQIQITAKTQFRFAPVFLRICVSLLLFFRISLGYIRKVRNALTKKKEKRNNDMINRIQPHSTGLINVKTTWYKSKENIITIEHTSSQRIF